MKKKKLNLNGLCTISDVEKKALMVQTFNKSIWVNLGDGTFLNKTKGIEKNEVKSSGQLYKEIKTVVANQQLIAKRIKKEDPLRFLRYPMTLSIYK